MTEDYKKAYELFHKKEYKKAKELFEKINSKGDNLDVLKYSGLCSYYLKEYNEALSYLKTVFEKNAAPDIEGYLGTIYYCLKDYGKAQVHLINSILSDYNDEFAKTLEKALLSKHNDEAMLGLKLLMNEHHPKDIFILRDITNIAQKLKKFDIAIEFFEILLKYCPDDYVAWNNMGLIYEETGDWVKSYNCYKKALSIHDFFSPNFNLGIMSRKLHKFNDSIQYLKKAILQNPNSPQPKYSLAMSYMMLKDFKNGYPLYANHMTKIMPSYYKREWDGKPHKESSLCIFTTGGLGDMIMFARYFEYVSNIFKKIYCLLPVNLHRIFKRNYPYIEFIDSNEIFTEYDFATTPMHILKFFDLDFTEFVPNTNGFLKTDENLTKMYKEKFFNNNSLKIAINWHGNREGTRTFFNRSMPLEFLEPVFNQFKEAKFYSIQKDSSHTECQKYPFIIDLYDEIEDFDTTASILENIDLLISIDSSPIHMAGAIGKKTYVLLPKANEWRWFIDDEKSVWYDSIELFRQSKEGDWASCVDKMLAKMELNYKN